MEDQAAEVATDADWRALMQRERKAQGFTQKTLAVAIGTSQATISEIESGELKGSKFVLAICRKLGIAPPMMFEDQLERRWVEGGRKLRARRSPLFLRMLEMVEEANSEHDTRTNPDPDRPH